MLQPRWVFCCAVAFFSCSSGVAYGQTIPACGQQLSPEAIYRGVPAKSNDGDQGQLGDCETFTPPLPACAVGMSEIGCSYGEHYQCVEFIRRFYSLRDDAAQRVDTSGWRHLNAVDYYNSPPAGFVAMLNGGPVPPAPDDILVFDEGGYGHVAIVRNVTSTSVDLIEENWSKTGVVSVSMTNTGGNFTVSSRQGRIEVYKAKGWVRRQASSVVYTFTGVPFNNFVNTTCPPTCRITGSITVAQPLPPNINDQQIGGSSSNFTPISFSFTDGVTTATNRTCPTDNIFNANTDASGNITQYAINVCFNHGGSYFYLSYDPPFGTLVGLNGTNNGAFYQAYFNDGSAVSGGAWSISTGQ